MLPHYSPFKVAENFSLLAGLFPGRIDLALGRASGTDPMTTFALQRDRRQAGPDDFPQQLAELLAYFDGGFPGDHPFAHLGAGLPGGEERPEVWLLGSSPQSAVWAAQLGLPYAFADFINPAGAEITASYRERFEPSPRLAEPRVAVAVWAVAAESGEDARHLATSIEMFFAFLHRGRAIPLPPPERAARYLRENDLTIGANGTRRRIVGTPAEVRAEIESVADSYGAEEAILVTVVHDHAARRRSYELVAREFGLTAAPADAAATA
jgi:luciferase family oxidoreductase group 1